MKTFVLCNKLLIVLIAFRCITYYSIHIQAQIRSNEIEQWSALMNLNSSLIMSNEKLLLMTQMCHKYQGMNARYCFSSASKSISKYNTFGEVTKYCNYSLFDVFFTKEYLSLQIQQQDCINKNPDKFLWMSESGTLLGGSSFDILVYDKYRIYECFVVDNFNFTYNVLCSLYGLINNSQMRCFYVTIILMHEYFDAYRDNIRDSLNFVISNNKEVCLFINKNSTYTLWNYNMRKNTSDIWMYTSIWNLISNNTTLSIINNTSELNKYIECCINNNNNNINMKVKKSFYPLKSNSIFNKHFYFQHTIMVKYSNHIEYFNSSLFGNTLNYFKFQKDYNYNKNLNLQNDMFIFIGSSHLRGYFEYLTLEYLGNMSHLVNISVNFKWKLSIDNLHFHFKAYTHEQIEYLTYICSILNSNNNNNNNANNNNNSNNNITMIFETGHWDLWSFPLRRVISSSYGIGEKLKKIISDILSGNLPCGNLRHFIFMTAVPFPFCHRYHKDNDACIKSKSYRTNSNIRILNDWYINHFKYLQQEHLIHHHIKLSIIDAFSITYPRMLLSDESNEFVCHHHFICRIRSDMIAVTPGGLAVLDSLHLALFGEKT